MTLAEINPEYAIQSNQQGQQFPALQVNDYEPRSLDAEINFCISEDSYQLIEDSSPLFNTEIIECIYNQKSTLMHKIITPVRWIFLNIPPLFAKDRDTGEISYLQKGERLKETNRVSAAKCFLACLVNGELIKSPDGKPEIFTLNLTSSKTNLIGSRKIDSTDKTLLDLNTGLQKFHKIKGNLIHLASVGVTAKPKVFQSSDKKTSSLGVMFYLEENAKALREEQQQEIFELVSDEKIQAIFNDPFGLKQSQDVNQRAGLVEHEEEEF